MLYEREELKKAMQKDAELQQQEYLLAKAG